MKIPLNTIIFGVLVIVPTGVTVAYAKLNQPTEEELDRKLRSNYRASVSVETERKKALVKMIQENLKDTK